MLWSARTLCSGPATEAGKLYAAIEHERTAPTVYSVLMMTLFRSHVRNG